MATSSSINALLPTAWLAASIRPSLGCSIFGHSMPGVSISAMLLPRYSRCCALVTAGSSPTLATRLFSSAFISVDLPTLGMPMIIMRSGFRAVPRCGASARHSLGILATSDGFLAGQRHRVHVLLRVVESQPGLRRRRVGQVALVQHLQARALAELAQFFDHRVAAGLRQARIQHFDDHVGLFHRLRRFLAGGVHVTGEPLDRHAVSAKGSRLYFTHSPQPEDAPYETTATNLSRDSARDLRAKESAPARPTLTARCAWLTSCVQQ